MARWSRVHLHQRLTHTPHINLQAPACSVIFFSHIIIHDGKTKISQRVQLFFGDVLFLVFLLSEFTIELWFGNKAVHC